MWRWIILALVAANGAFWLWSHEQLRPWGLGPIEVHEPERLKDQIQPEALQVTPQEPVAPATQPAALPVAVSATTPATPAAPAAPAASTTAPMPTSAAPSVPAPLPAKGK